MKPADWNETMFSVSSESKTPNCCDGLFTRRSNWGFCLTSAAQRSTEGSYVAARKIRGR
jgi:hypothetical protein